MFFAEIESLNGFYQIGLIKTAQASAWTLDGCCGLLRGAHLADFLFELAAVAHLLEDLLSSISARILPVLSSGTFTARNNPDPS
ncbi:MAG: hypothetical protein LUQ32_01065 [Methanomicrobiales archaeon]|nr:hypothetical protein [Methanomicrobiales archaeon]